MNTLVNESTNLSKIEIDRLINEILKKAKSLRGYTLKQLTSYLEINHPESLLHAKGLTGQIIEFLLGATAQSKPLPDFPELNLEIKSIPIDINENPLETTYICQVPLLHKNTKNIYDFKQSVLYKKIFKILWLPIITNKNQDSTQRTIGSAFIWGPNSSELSLIEQDWLELTEMVQTGDIEKVSSHFGQVLQIRPKAANSSCVTNGIGESGENIKTLPRGFYLRTNFTKQILKKHHQNNEILP